MTPRTRVAMWAVGAVGWGWVSGYDFAVGRVGACVMAAFISLGYVAIATLMAGNKE